MGELGLRVLGAATTPRREAPGVLIDVSCDDGLSQHAGLRLLITAYQKAKSGPPEPPPPGVSGYGNCGIASFRGW